MKTTIYTQRFLRDDRLLTTRSTIVHHAELAPHQLNKFFWQLVLHVLILLQVGLGREVSRGRTWFVAGLVLELTELSELRALEYYVDQ